MICSNALNPKHTCRVTQGEQSESCFIRNGKKYKSCNACWEYQQDIKALMLLKPQERRGGNRHKYEKVGEFYLPTPELFREEENPDVHYQLFIKWFR